MYKILITLLALWALTGMSFAATKKHHVTKHKAKHVTSSTKARTSKRSSRTKTQSRRGSPSRTRHSYQAAPTQERYKEIQTALASKGYFKGEANGQWGPDSVNALRRFQTDQNLEPDGKLGSLSLIAMGLGPKRITAQAKPDAQTASPNQANPPVQSKQ